MGPDDVVDLIILAGYSNYIITVCRRGAANSFIRDWYNARDSAMKMSWWRLLLSSIYWWKRPHTMAWNALLEDGTTSAQWAIDTKQIVGVYIRERGVSASDTMAESVKKM